VQSLGRRRAAIGILISVIVLVLCVDAPASASASESATQRLADAYAPIVMMRAQRDGLCNTSEEQYGPPTTVNVVLRNPRVQLVERVGRRMVERARAPGAADLAGKGENFYLNLPGNPLNPGCTYARDYAALRRAGKAPAITYAHMAREPGYPGFALQYWFYYYFNQFNDLHESDWEGMQITFNATSAKQALSVGPNEIVVFQHSGGEHTSWTDSRVQKRGRHPVVYSAAGSHATFYKSALWLGTGQNGSGVGCDNTTAPLTAFHPRAVLLPDTVPRTGRFAWLDYDGHWGQREAGFNNGPQGPNTKKVWKTPFSWMDGTRTRSPEVPGESLMGPTVSDTFCGAVATVSRYINFKAQTSAGAIGIGLACAVLVILPLFLTTWRPVKLEPLRTARAGGQIVLAAGRLCGRHLGRLILIALVALLVVALLDGLESLLRHLLSASNSGAVTDSGNQSGISPLPTIGRTIATPFAAAMVIAFIRNLERGQDTRFPAIVMAVLRRVWRLVVVELLILLCLVVLAATIIGIPVAIVKFIDWQFAQQEILFEDRPIRDAMRGSARLVRGHRWHTGTVAIALWVLSQAPAVLLGAAFIFTSIPAVDINLFGAIVYALLVVYVSSGRTLLYLDLAYRHEHAPARAHRARRLWRKRPATAAQPGPSTSSA
jgi:hypothetical protein